MEVICAAIKPPKKPEDKAIMVQIRMCFLIIGGDKLSVEEGNREQGIGNR
jgi:hypothetical protein